jgi:hypothetical protein
MIRSLHLENFRGFPQYEVGKLGRINLFVGTNNSGKTSLLEAIELLLAHGDARTIWNSLSRRGERGGAEDEREPHQKLDVSHLFFGHVPSIGSSFSIQTRNESSTQRLVGEILERTGELTMTDFLVRFPGDWWVATLNLQWSNEGQEEVTGVPLSRNFAMSSDTLRFLPVRSGQIRTPLSFVPTDSFSQDEVIASLSGIVLDPEEEFVLQALRIIDPSIERIAPVVERLSPALSQRSRGGVMIKSSKYPTRLPIGSLGDGIWHLMSLALALVRARGGVLLVDEIDTGLHYSVMENMWHLVQKTASRLDVQVFATTHSSDCWKALASICSREKLDGSEVSMQRIEPDKPEAILFQEQEIVIAAEQDIEVR